MDEIMHEVLLGQGRMEGKVDGVLQRLDRGAERMDVIEERLRHVEQRSAVAGAIGGGVLGTAMALLVEVLKTKFGN